MPEYIFGLYSAPTIYVFNFLLTPHFLKYHSFIKSLVIGYCWLSSFAFLFQSCVGLPRFFVFLFDFWNQPVNFSKTPIEIIDQFGKNRHLNNNESIYPQVRYLYLFRSSLLSLNNIVFRCCSSFNRFIRISYSLMLLYMDLLNFSSQLHITNYM